MGKKTGLKHVKKRNKKTPLRFNVNASTFEVKRKCVSSKT